MPASAARGRRGTGGATRRRAAAACAARSRRGSQRLIRLGEVRGELRGGFKWCCLGSGQPTRANRFSRERPGFLGRGGSDQADHQEKRRIRRCMQVSVSHRGNLPGRDSTRKEPQTAGATGKTVAAGGFPTALLEGRPRSSLRFGRTTPAVESGRTSPARSPFHPPVYALCNGCNACAPDGAGCADSATGG